MSPSPQPLPSRGLSPACLRVGARTHAARLWSDAVAPRQIAQPPRTTATTRLAAQRVARAPGRLSEARMGAGLWAETVGGSIPTQEGPPRVGMGLRGPSGWLPPHARRARGWRLGSIGPTRTELPTARARGSVKASDPPRPPQRGPLGGARAASLAAQGGLRGGPGRLLPEEAVPFDPGQTYQPTARRAGRRVILRFSPCELGASSSEC
eukprot:scaffold6670_cov330-Prasinococcus_capsulatus_cf.AAC.2